MSGKFILKMVLLGDSSVGKTSLRKRFMGQGYRSEHLTTIGADFAAKDSEINYSGQKQNVTFQIWDLAGQQRFESVRSRFFFGTMAGLCVFDITREESFKNIRIWIEELWKSNGKGVIPIALIGNKSDLRGRKSISVKNAIEYCRILTEKTKKYGFDVNYIETSAKTGLNIEEAFEAIGKKIIDVNYR